MSRRVPKRGIAVIPAELAALNVHPVLALDRRPFGPRFGGLVRATERLKRDDDDSDHDDYRTLERVPRDRLRDRVNAWKLPRLAHCSVLGPVRAGPPLLQPRLRWVRIPPRFQTTRRGLVREILARLVHPARS